MTALRVLIADDHPAFRTGLAGMLSTADGIEVVGNAADGADAIAQTRSLQPDVVLMDLHMPGLGGLEAIEAIAAEMPAVAIVVLTMVEDPDALLTAMRGGASGYLLKGADRDDVVRAVTAAAAGEIIFSTGVAAGVRAYFAGPPVGSSPLPELTDREVEVLDLIARGMRNNEIASALFLSEKTVRNHVSNIFAKLGVDRSGAIIRAREAGLGRGS